MSKCADYIGHYKADAEEFDYFQNADPTDVAYEDLFRKFLTTLAGKPKTVVDIGSGGGWTSRIPHERIMFVDLAMKNLAALKSETAAPLMADAHVLPFKSGTVEFLIASEIIEHLNSPELAASEIWRVLRPGGKAIVSTPYNEKLRYTLCIHCNKPTPWNAHLHSFDDKKILSLFPADARTSVYKSGSKILTLLRAARIFRRLPFVFWRWTDRLLVRLVDKAQHLIVVIEK